MLTDVNLRIWYASSRGDLGREFYAPCLGRSIIYDRAVGFFSSGVYAVSGTSLLEFVKAGGRIRLVCSPHLAARDLAAINEGSSLDRAIDEALVDEIRALTLHPEGLAATKLLATLISAGVLDIKIAYRPGHVGIFHSKVGIFEDQAGNRVAFDGSPNETGAALLSNRNHESFQVFRSWAAPIDAERIDLLRGYFASLWSNLERDLEVRPLSDVPADELRTYENPEGLDAAIEEIEELRPETSLFAPAQRRELMSHQASVVASWFDAGHRGIVKHATGAGKTLTALEVVRRWLGLDRPAVITVPSALLAQQWADEISQELADLSPMVLRVGGPRSDRRWREQLGDFTANDRIFGPRIVIATIQSASTADFAKSIRAGQHLLIVADEVHRVGAEQFQLVTRIDAGGRLGLSATPERYGDPGGTAAILAYFGEILSPEFTLREGIIKGGLVPYDYHVHAVELSTDEVTAWSALTAKIRQRFARLSDDARGDAGLDDQLRLMLIRRAAILKQASAKPAVAVEVLSHNYQEGDRWLVYCDEGSQLEDVVARLREIDLPVLEYRSAMDSSKHGTLSLFEHRGGVLVAIRCLDEGVDIPSADRALVLASSRNPREFIQRRGRVLRVAPRKHFAVIHDAMVVPPLDPGTENASEVILGTELRRAAIFAADAQNRAVLYDLREIARTHGVEIDAITGIEGYE